jgi:predicted HTH transcriptional regulator
LWSQVDQLTDLLSLFNYSFRLKAEISKQVQAYHPIALKEMLINAVVHRDYERNEPIELTITPNAVSM